MSRKSKYSFDQKKWAVEQYLNGNKSTVEIAERLKMPSRSGATQVRRWVSSISKQA